MAVSQLTFLAPQPGASYQTRSGTFTADGSGFISNVPLTGSAVGDLVASGCIPLAAGTSANFRNLLDGGDFTVNPWQRNVAGLATTNTNTTTISNTATYFPDRFFAIGGASSSIQLTNVVDATIPGFGQSCFFSRKNATTDVAPLNFGQVLEPVDVIRCQGQTVTFSFWARAGALYSGGPLTAQIVSGTGNAANNTAANLAAGTWTTPVVVATTAISLISSMTRYSITGIVPAGATELGVLLTWTPGVGTAGATDGINVNGLQLELGGLSPFEHRDVQVETEICQRYAWLVAEPAAGVIVGAGMNTSANTQIFYMAPPVQFAKAPTVSVATGTFKTLQHAVATAGTITAGTTHTPNAISVNCNSAGTIGEGVLLQGGGGTGYILASADY